MSLDFQSLADLRAHHPAWRLLRYEHAPLVASFLHRAFIAPNLRTIDSASLAASLDDDLFALRQSVGDEAFPKAARDYLDEWASPERGWLRKFYSPGSDEPRFDLTPASEKAIAWLAQLGARSFVGTESRLRTLFELLRQMSEGRESDPEKRLAELRKRRDEIDAEIARVDAGDLPMLDDTGLKERFLHFLHLARELLADFREVEQNFRLLDRNVRERIALWEGGKGTLLEEIMGERDAIADSDQGRSFRAFWEFLMSSRRQEELSRLLDDVLAQPPIAALEPDTRTRRVHYDWLEAGEHTQRTVAHLSQQLRRFLDDQAWLENRRIMDLLHSIEAKALSLRETPPSGEFTSIAETSASIELPFERPLFTPPLEVHLSDSVLAPDDGSIDPAGLYAHVVVDKARLARHLRHCLQGRAQITLREVVERQPLQQGLAELVTYLHLASTPFRSIVDEEVLDIIEWEASAADGAAIRRRAQVPRLIFVRGE